MGLNKELPEYLKLTPNGVKGKFISFTGKSGEHWVSIIPSLNVSGYGESEEDALKDSQYNIRVLFEDLHELTSTQRDKELKKLGWLQNKFFKRQYSSSYVDENGVLKNFDSPNQVKKSVLEPANA